MIGWSPLVQRSLEEKKQMGQWDLYIHHYNDISQSTLYSSAVINYALWDKSEGEKVHFKSSGSGKKKEGNMGHVGSIMVEAVKNRLGSYYPQILNKMRNRDVLAILGAF